GGTLAALAVTRAVVAGPRWWRIAIAALCVALAALEWLFVLSLTVLPPYTGPIAEGSPLPAFHAQLADGADVDQAYFQQPGATALVFFQGRWCPFCMTQLKELEAAAGDFQRAGARVVAVSVEDVATAAESQREFPHVTFVSDKSQELS